MTDFEQNFKQQMYFSYNEGLIFNCASLRCYDAHILSLCYLCRNLWNSICPEYAHKLSCWMLSKAFSKSIVVYATILSNY